MFRKLVYLHSPMSYLTAPLMCNTGLAESFHARSTLV